MTSPICPKSIKGLELNNKGYIVIGENCQTNISEIFAGGDIVTRSGTVISAMGAGKKAAHQMDKFLKMEYKDIWKVQNI